MYFSKHNKEIIYINHYSGLLEVEGKGVLCREDTEVMPTPTENLAKEYDVLSITEGITEVRGGFLDAFPNIDCMILSRTVESAAVTPELLKRWRKRKVLVRGEYDTFAERFAAESNLKFLHSDIPLAEYDLERPPEHDIVTLRFFADSKPDIHYNCFTSGSSASNFGGGEVSNELPKDFYVGCTVEKFANHFSEQARDQILSNETLRRFLEISNARHEARMTEKQRREEEAAKKQ